MGNEEIFNLRQWFTRTVRMVDAQGYRVTPVYPSGKALPFGNGETYPDPFAPCWDGAKYIGVVLDDVMLLDYDGNKAAARGSIISLSDLTDALGLKALPQPVQRNEEGDSLHYLFRCPESFNKDQYAQSCNGGWLPYIDIKWGNQLMNLKPHKAIVCGQLPTKDSLWPAPEILMEALHKGEFRPQSEYPKTSAWDGSRGQVEEAREILKYIEPAEKYDEWIDVLMRIHDKFGATDAAVEIADEWSRRAENYGGIDEVRTKLQSFEPRT